MKNKIKVKCLDDFTLKNKDNTKILAEIKKGEYTATLYEPTQEYFAKDVSDREFLVGEVVDDNIVLQEGFVLCGTCSKEQILSIIDKEIEWSHINAIKDNVTNEQLDWYILGLKQAKVIIKNFFEIE